MYRGRVCGEVRRQTRAVKSRRGKGACDDLYRETANAEGQGAACGWAGGSAVGAVVRSQFGIPATAPGTDPRAIALRSACLGSDRVKAITCSRSETQMGSRKCGAELPV